MDAQSIIEAMPYRLQLQNPFGIVILTVRNDKLDLFSPVKMNHSKYVKSEFSITSNDAKLFQPTEMIYCVKNIDARRLLAQWRNTSSASKNVLEINI